MVLTLAGPGAGKTTDMVEQIAIRVAELNSNREMAIITYTNASADDIKKKLADKIIISPNIFIGTIHSFLVHYFIKPYANYLGFKANPMLIVEKFNDVGVDWIEKWVKEKNPNKNAKERKILVDRMLLKRRNQTVHSAAKKGIYTYDSIVKIARELSEKTEVMDSISKKIQFLFVDEYQDISSYGHNIILKIEKRNHTQINMVGDPDQSIYRFRYGHSQIGERAPQEGKQPIRDLIKNEKCEKRNLLINHRSSEEIVNFINRYTTLEKQVPEKEAVCKIHIIKSTDTKEIYKIFSSKCMKYKCKDKLVISEKNKCLKSFEEFELKKKTRIDVRLIQDYLISASGLKYDSFLEKYDMTPFEVKRIAVGVRRILESNPQSDIKETVEQYCKTNHIKTLKFGDSAYKDENGKLQKYGFSANFENSDSKEDELNMLTIHKAKGLEADGILVVAENSKQFFKWLNMSSDDLKNETDEEYRLGYVAYSRPKKLLVLSCLEDIDCSKLDKGLFEII
ncbi:MAG: UvrD-helicase domain-containing protein [Anaerostipes sp.]|jgi:DNA helicase-2/ATP-dependent DNA helicase PcrA